jgi:hypothetical protein
MSARAAIDALVTFDLPAVMILSLPQDSDLELSELPSRVAPASVA